MRAYRLASYALLTLAATALYGATMHTSVQPADNGELQLVALTFGIAHPPGYPLWSMLAGLFARLPGLPALTGMALFSVASAVATLIVMAHTVEMVVGQCSTSGGALAVGIAAAALFAVGTTFWVQATTVNIRALTTLFAALLTWVAARAYCGRTLPSVLGVIVGMAVAHHPSLAFPALPVVAYVLLTEGRRGVGNRMLRFAVWAAAVQVVWLYLPLRDVPGAAFAPGGLRTLSGFLDHALARGFGGDMFWFLFVEPARLADRLMLLPMLSSFALGTLPAVAFGLGTLVALVRRRALAAVGVASIIVHLFVTLTYRAPQTVEYALPAWVLIAVLGGVGIGSLVNTRRVAVRLLPAVSLGALAVLGAAFQLPEFMDAARDRTARDRAAAVLSQAPRDAVVLAQWHQATALWAVQAFENLRRDVFVEYVAPAGAQPYAETFAARARAASSRPIVTTSLFDREFAAAGLRAEPLLGADGWTITDGAAPDDSSSNDAKFDGRIVARVNVVSPARVEPGDLIPVDVSWSVDGGAGEGDAVTVRIFRADGRLASNADVQLPFGERRGLRRVLLGAPLDLPPGEYVMRIGAYRAQNGAIYELRTTDGATFVDGGAISVSAVARPAVTRRPLAPFGCAEFCVEGVDYDLGVPGRVRLWVHVSLGAAPRELRVFDAAGISVAAPCVAPPGVGRHFSCAFDIPPLRGLALRVDDVVVTLPDYIDGELYVPFGGRMVLMEMHLRESATDAIVDLHWTAARRLTDDYIVSVRVGGAAHDGVPALGALPTLKWMRGQRIEDRHPVPLVDGHRGGVIVVYDSVSRLDLPILDERYLGRFTFELSQRP
jgi:hypothetical protein